MAAPKMIMGKFARRGEVRRLSFQKENRAVGHSISNLGFSNATIDHFDCAVAPPSQFQIVRHEQKARPTTAVYLPHQLEHRVRDRHPLLLAA
jgi:hypothetical protein